jgi:hypothetical protein
MATLARGRAARWTKDKIDSLPTPDVRQLRANAERLNEPEIAALCDQVLGARPRRAAASGTKAKPKVQRSA